MKSIIRTVSIILAVALLMSMFAGCSKKAENNAGSQKSDEQQVSDATTLPITNKDITLKYWVPLTSNAVQVLKSFNDNEVYKELQKRTGIKIDFMHPAQKQVDEQFNLMIAAGDYPDLIGNASKYKGGGERAVEQNVYVKLNDLINKYAPNYKKLRDSNPNIKKETVTDTGTIWCFYEIVPFEETISVGPLIKENWLKELNLKNPVTIDDWYTVLRTFKEKKGTQAPLLMGPKGFFESGAFVSAFDTANDFYIKDGKVRYGFIEPGMKEYLTTMNKWYKEGLIDKDFVTRDKPARDALLFSEKAGAVVDSPSNITKFKQANLTMGTPDYPVLTPGQKLHFRDKSNNVFTPNDAATTAISTSCKYQAEAVKWLDYAYSEEGSMLFNYGIEGMSYNMVNGKPVFTDLVIKNPEGLLTQLTMWKYKVHSAPNLRLASASNPTVVSNPEVLDIRKKWTDNVGTEYVLPFISLTAEEGEKTTTILSQVDTYKDEMILKFILGTVPISNFDEYVATIKKLGIDEAVKIRQAAVDRFNKR